MAGSLQDQLVKAGLATTAQAKKAERQKRAEEQARRQGENRTQQATGGNKKKNKNKGRSDPSAAAYVRQRAQQLKAEKVAHDRAVAQERNKKYADRALRAEIKQIILQNDQRARTTTDDDLPYNFIHGKKIKRIYVPAAQKDQLIKGTLVIVNNDGLYHFVSREVADQIAARDPKRIIVAHDGKSAEPSEDDEYYAKFAVPDDLDW